jgi:hypothetical protein
VIPGTVAVSLNDSSIALAMSGHDE